MFDIAEFEGGFAMFVTVNNFDLLSFLRLLLRRCLTFTAFVRLEDDDDVFAATTKPLLRRAFSLAIILFILTNVSIRV